MIPYDDLVVALAAWRARQGLPVAQLTAAQAARSRAAAAPAPAPAPVPAARVTPARPAAAQVPAASDFDDGALVEDGYDSGEDYVMQLGDSTAEPTAISGVPEPVPTGRGKRW